MLPSPRLRGAVSSGRLVAISFANSVFSTVAAGLTAAYVPFQWTWVRAVATLVHEAAALNEGIDIL
jgi:hypothetical protein